MSSSPRVVRFGILGAASVARYALIAPAREHLRAEVVAVAARDSERAAAFAADNGVAAVEPSYAALVDRDDVDAVYVALPAAAHHEWATYALEAGKHVLCEKPLTVTAAEAADLVATAERTRAVLAEAFHYHYHPLMARVREIVGRGELGRITYAEGVHVNNVARTRPVYWDRRLGGGATLHTGCYPVHALRSVMGTEPDVEAASAEWVDGTDAWLTADLRFPDGPRATIRSSMAHTGLPENYLHLQGTRGELHAGNFIVPHLGSRYPTPAVVHTRIGDTVHDEAFGPPATYAYQLDAFVDAVASGAAMATSGADSVANMAVMDAMHAAAAPPDSR